MLLSELDPVTQAVFTARQDLRDRDRAPSERGHGCSMVSDARVFSMFSHSLLLAAAPVSSWVYAAFVVVVLLLLCIDLGILHRKAHVPTLRESLGWTAGWVGMALVIACVVYFLYEHHWGNLGAAVPVLGSPGESENIGGWEAARLYLAAYLIEKSLSMDNVFVISMIFTSLAIPVSLQHRVLFWGILGAITMRGAMIGAGAAMMAEFWWVSYVFGAALIFSALKMMLAGHERHDISHGWLVRLISRFLPASDRFDGQRMISHIDGRWHATPLLVAMLVIEVSDVMFAVDSIPAVFAITGDPFIVFTSNIMAVLGLRSLYFCLASAVLRFRYLKAALVAVLLYVGVKMCLVHMVWRIPAEVSVFVVAGLLLSGLLASLLAPAVTVACSVGSEVSPALPVEEPAGRGGARIWRTNRVIRRCVVLSTGTLIIVAGVIVSPLPGPGLLILGPLGIGILASEFLWARRLATHGMAHEHRAREMVHRIVGRVSRLFMVPLVLLFGLMAWWLSTQAWLPSWALWGIGVPLTTPSCYVLYCWYRVRASRRTGDDTNG